jgi:release factor glutamine methyltransferase
MPAASFFGLPLVAAPGRVMTPRPASEGLVEAALERIGDRPARVVDVGTGSGAIAIAIASMAPAATVWATDNSRRAVALAKRNVRAHGLEHRVLVRHANLLDRVPGALDLVVANLPYLPEDTAASRPELAKEPRGAIYAAGDGLGPYRRLLASCEDRLSANGFVAIQLHRSVLTATRDELGDLYDRIEARAVAHGARLALRPAAAAAAAA